MVVSAFYVHIWSNEADEPVRRVLVERSDSIDAAECAKHGHPIGDIVQRPLGAFQAADTVVVVHGNDHDIAETCGLLQILDVAAMENVENAVGKHDAPACGSCG